MSRGVSPLTKSADLMIRDSFGKQSVVVTITGLGTSNSDNLFQEVKEAVEGLGLIEDVTVETRGCDA